MNTDSLAGMEDLARMMLDRELAALRSVSTRVSVIEKRIAELDAEKSRAMAAASGGGVSNQLGRWLAWQRRRRIALGRDLAGLMADLEQQRAAATRAFGRAQALEGLGRLQEAEDRQAAQRRVNEGR